MFHVACLFNCIAISGHIPDNVCSNVIFPILKSGKLDPETKSSYRVIALSNRLSKLFDYVILERHQSSLDMSDAQFTLKASSSANHCFLIVKEVLWYYMQRGSDPVTCLLDLKKAFNRVNIGKLTSKPTRHNIPPFALGLIQCHYNCQSFRVS